MKYLASDKPLVEWVTEHFEVQIFEVTKDINEAKRHIATRKSQLAAYQEKIKNLELLLDELQQKYHVVKVAEQ